MYHLYCPFNWYDASLFELVTHFAKLNDTTQVINLFQSIFLNHPKKNLASDTSSPLLWHMKTIKYHHLKFDRLPALLVLSIHQHKS